MRTLTLLVALVLPALAGCSRSVVLTNASDSAVRATLSRELIGSGDRTLDAATIAPGDTVRLGPVKLVTERVILSVQPAVGLGNFPLKQRLGFGQTDLTIVTDAFNGTGVRLIEEPAPEDWDKPANSPQK